MRGSHHLWPLFRFSGIFFLEWRFVLVLWRFSGHFPSVAMVCPGIVLFSGTFPFRRGGLSWFYGAFQDILLSRGVLSRFCRPNKDVLLLPEDFLPELWGFSGYFLSGAAFCPGFAAKIRIFCCSEDFLPESCCFSGHFSFAVCCRD